MKKNQEGFSAAPIVVMLLVLSLIGLTGWYVWNNQKSDNSAEVATEDKATNNNQTPVAPLVLTESKLPAGWTAEINEPGRVFLSAKTSGCSADALYTTDTAESNSPDVDHNKKLVDGIKSKGYSVEEASGKITIVTPAGKKQLDALIVRVTGQNNPAFQKYAYIAKSDSYTQIQLSCPAEADLPTAEAALLAVEFTKE